MGEWCLPERDRRNMFLYAIVPAPKRDSMTQKKSSVMDKVKEIKRSRDLLWLKTWQSSRSRSRNFNGVGGGGEATSRKTIWSLNLRNKWATWSNTLQIQQHGDLWTKDLEPQSYAYAATTDIWEEPGELERSSIEEQVEAFLSSLGFLWM